MKTKTIADFLIFASLVMTGCANKPIIPPEPVDVCRVSGATAPEWVCAPEKTEGMITAVVSAHTKYPGGSLARMEAMSSGETRLKEQVKNDIAHEIEQFIRSSGGLSDTMTQSVSALITNEVAYTSLKHFRELRQWENKPERKLYLLVGADRNAINGLTKRSIAKALRQYSPLKQWARNDFRGEPLTPAKTKLYTSEFSEPTVGYTRNVEFGEDEPLFMVEEPMIEVVSEGIVGRNRPR